MKRKMKETFSINDKKPQLVSTGRMTDTEKYLTFRLLRSLSDSSAALLLETQRACFVGKTANADFVPLEPPNQIIGKSVCVCFL